MSRRRYPARADPAKSLAATEGHGAGPDVPGRCLKVSSPQPQHRLGTAFHRWTLPDGSLWASFHHERGGCTIRFPGLADFEIGITGRDAVCRPCSGLTEATRQHLFLNQVWPLMLSRQGVPVFHGSAVEVGAAAVAFLGAAGRGKSTLAAALAIAGGRHLSDDALIVERRGAGFALLPAAPSIRLWPDSREELFPEEVATAPAVSYTSKSRILEAPGVAHAAGAVPLARAFFLGDGCAAEVAVEPLSGAEAAAAWVAHSFILDLDDGATLGRNFEQVALLAEQVSCYRLDYPRRYGMLDRVREAILATA